MRMKVIQINCVYGVGSTGKIVQNIHNHLLNNGVASSVIVPMTNSKDKNVFCVSNKFLSYSSAFYRRSSGRQFDGANIQTGRIIRLLKEQKPDIVHLHCINGNNINIYRLLNYLGSEKIKTVLTLHAEFPYTGGCGHAYDCEKWKYGCFHCPILREATQSYFIDGTKHTWKSQKKCYENFSDDRLRIVAVSPWLKSRSEQSPMLKRFEKSVIMNGCNTSVFHRYGTGYWRKKLNIPDNIHILLHVTASFSPYGSGLKGGRFIYQLSEKLKNKPFVILVASNYGEAPNCPSNVIFIGRTETQEHLAGLYSEADLTVITSKRETFSMVTAESLCCGTPVASFFAGGPESIAIPEYSFFCEYGDIDSMADYIENLNYLHYNKDEISTKAKSKYSIEKMTEEYLSLYNEMGAI